MKQILRTNLALRAFMLVALFVGAVSSAWADEVTLTPTGIDGNGVVAFTSTSSDVTFNLTAFKNNGTTAPTFNTNGADFRIYAKGTLTISAPETVIRQITFNISAQGKRRLATITASEGLIDGQAPGDATVTWSGEESEVTFTVGDHADFGSDGSGKAGQLCFTSIDIVTGTGDTPLLQPAGLSFGDVTSFTITEGDAFTAPALVNPNNLAVRYSSDNEDVATVNSQTGAVSIEGVGTANITATFEGDNTYRAGHASYTLTVKEPAALVGNIARLAAQEAGDYILTLTNAVVTYVDPTGKYAFLEDASGAITVYSKDGQLTKEVTVPFLGTYKLQPGLTMNGTAQVALTIFNGLPEIELTIDDIMTAVQARTVTVSQGTAPQPFEGSVELLSGDDYAQYLARYMSLQGVKVTAVSGKSVTVVEGQQQFTVYLQNGGTMEVNHVYNLVGAPGIYKTNRQFVVYDENLIKDVTEQDGRTQTELSFAQSSMDMTVGDAMQGIEAVHNLADFPNAVVSYAVEPDGIISYENGVVTALAAGTATITATIAETSDYTGATATLSVNVTEPVVEADETIVFAELGYENGAEVTEVVSPTKATSLFFEKGTNTNNVPKYYDTGAGVRLYSGNTLSFLSDREIVRIEFTFSGNYKNVQLAEGQEGSYSDGVWTGSASEVVFTNGKDQSRIQQIAITYGDGEVIPRLSLSFADVDGVPITSLNMKELEDRQIYVVAELNGKQLSWVPFEAVSDNADIMDVENGEGMSLILSANGVGTSSIVVTVEDGETEDAESFRGASATLTVKVTTNKVESELAFNPATLDLEVGTTADVQLSTNLTSLNDVEIKNSNPEVATYENGVVKALAAGTTTITATIAETTDHTAARATLRITVEEAIDPSAEVILFTGYAEENTELSEPIYTDRATVTFDKGEGTSMPQYYVNGDAVRFYQSNILSITSEINMIEKIEFRFTSASYNTLTLADEDNGVLGTSETAGNIAIWTGNATEVNFTIPKSGGQSRIQRIIIYYSNEVGIAQTREALTRDNSIYDLTGRRVTANKAGLYIIGGRKVLVK